MLLKFPFLSKYHKTNRISSIRRVAVTILQTRKNTLSRRDKTICETNSERVVASVSLNCGMFAIPRQW